MGTIYIHNGDEKLAVAIYENGKIYSTYDGFMGIPQKSALIGEYDERGYVYSVRSNSKTGTVAICKGGDVCSLSYTVAGFISESLPLASCHNGVIYYDSKKVGEYDGDVQGAAASVAIAVLKLTSGVRLAYGQNNEGEIKDDLNMDKVDVIKSSNGNGIIAVMVIAFLVLLVMVFVLITSIYSYMPVIYMAVPAVIVVFKLIRLPGRKKKVSFFEKIKGFVKGAVLSFVIRFFVTPLEMIFMNFAVTKSQVFDPNMSTVIMLVISGLAGVVSCMTEKKKK